MTTVISRFYRTSNYLLKITHPATKLPIYPPPFRHFSSLTHFHKHLVCNPIYETRHSFGQLPQLPIKPPTYPTPFWQFSSLRHFHKHFVCNASSNETRDAFGKSGSYRKPSGVKWRKEICNSVQLIGIVGLPVKLTHLKLGKVVGRTRLGVEKSRTDKSWITLKFWDELAHIAHRHLQKGNQIYVSGHLRSDVVASEEGKERTYYEVDVEELNFVEKGSSSPVSVSDESDRSMAPAEKFSNSAAPTKLSTQELWNAFFANPTEWWDNRNDKKTPKSPDFKHKDTGEALWLDGGSTPPWVKSQLEKFDSRMQSYQKPDEPGLFSYLNVEEHKPQPTGDTVERRPSSSGLKDDYCLGFLPIPSPNLA